MFHAVVSFGSAYWISAKTEVYMHLNVVLTSLVAGAALLRRSGTQLRNQKRRCVTDSQLVVQEQGRRVRFPPSATFLPGPSWSQAPSQDWRLDPDPSGRLAIWRDN